MSRERVTGGKQAEPEKKLCLSRCQNKAARDDKKGQSKSDKNNSTYCELVIPRVPDQKGTPGPRGRGGRCNVVFRRPNPSRSCQRSADRSKQRGPPVGRRERGTGGREEERETAARRDAVVVLAAITVPRRKKADGPAQGTHGGRRVRRRGEREGRRKSVWYSGPST